MSGTTNCQQWNPSQNNQETDAQYTANSQRLSGATNPSLFASVLANKLFYQLTTYMTALFQAFAAKGYSTSDTSLSALTAQCANFLTTADLRADMQTVAFSGTLTLDCSKANGFQITLTGNLTSLTLANATFGQKVSLAFTQDSIGGRAVTFPANVLAYGAVDGTAGATSTQVFQQLGDGNLHPVSVMTVS